MRLCVRIVNTKIFTSIDNLITQCNNTAALDLYSAAALDLYSAAALNLYSQAMRVQDLKLYLLAAPQSFHPQLSLC